MSLSDIICSGTREEGLALGSDLLDSEHVTAVQLRWLIHGGAYPPWGSIVWFLADQAFSVIGIETIDIDLRDET